MFDDLRGLANVTTPEQEYLELVETYKKTGELPLIWQWVARDMLSAANTIRHHRQGRRDEPRRSPGDIRFQTSVAPILLLYGLALENLLKGLLVAQGVPATVTGSLNPELKTHNLLHLWRRAKLSADDTTADILNRLHWCIETARYPVGIKPDPKAPGPVLVALTSVRTVISLIDRVEDELRALRPKGLFEKTDLASFGVD